MFSSCGLRLASFDTIFPVLLATLLRLLLRLRFPLIVGLFWLGFREANMRFGANSLSLIGNLLKGSLSQCFYITFARYFYFMLDALELQVSLFFLCLTLHDSCRIVSFFGILELTLHDYPNRACSQDLPKLVPRSHGGATAARIPLPLFALDPWKK